MHTNKIYIAIYIAISWCQIHLTLPLVKFDIQHVTPIQGPRLTFCRVIADSDVTVAF